MAATLVVHEVTPEELSRTEPRLRDLSIALAAGAAGMYSVVRKDLSSVVPGVAIAVALVPPLATVGLMAELGEWGLARGAALLYLVNVLAIVLAAVAVLLATDFMESPSFHDSHRVVDADVTPGRVSVVIAGPTSPSGLDRLRTAIATEAHPDPVLDVEWVRSMPVLPD